MTPKPTAAVSPARGGYSPVMYAKLLLTRYEVRSRTWRRAGQPVYFEGKHGSAEAVARAFGDSWRGEGSDERRHYTVLTEAKPFDRERQ